jgi:hypothetical protein
MKILDLGKFINSIFKEMDINIYPVIAENSALKDYAIYERVDTRFSHKDRQLAEATYNVSIVCQQYDKSVELLQRVIDACRKIYSFMDNRIQLDIMSTSESYNEAYLQLITIKIDIC